MIKKQTKDIYGSNSEKILAIAGLSILMVGFLASLYALYNAFTDQQFPHDFIELIYHARYIILLGGGFAIGYLMTKHPSQQARYHGVYSGVIYAFLSMALFVLFDIVRVYLQNAVGYAPVYPWGKMIFMGMPLPAILAALVIAYVTRHKTNLSGPSTIPKIVILLSFITYQVYSHASGVYSLLTGTATYAPDTPVWLIVSSYLMTPLVVAIISYLLLTNMKRRFDRLFYAALIGALFSTLTFILWEFRIDPSVEATDSFSALTTTITVLFTGILLWRLRRTAA